MRIAVYTLHPEEARCGELVSLLRERLGDAEILFPCCEDVFCNQVPDNLQAAFVCVDNMRALECARKLRPKNIPLVFISDSPDYAMEGIRLEVRYYIIRPVDRENVETALARLGLDRLEGC